YFFGAATLQSDQYDLAANTGRLAQGDLVACVVALVRNVWTADGQRDKETRGQGDGGNERSREDKAEPTCVSLSPPLPVSLSSSGRVLTLARAFGAGDTGLAPTLARRL